MIDAIDLFAGAHVFNASVSAADIERFAAKVERAGDCWRWTAGLMGGGYGQFHYQGSPRYAHRWLYEQLHGPVSAELTMDHLCRNRWCVNPSHLEPVTRGENVLRGISPAARAAMATACPSGHPYSGENLAIKSDGSRRCRACHRARERMRRSS